MSWGWKLSVLWGLFAPTCALAQSHGRPAPDLRARQNLLFAWESAPKLVAQCLSSATCAGADSKVLESLLKSESLPSELQPDVVFYQDRKSDFCLNSRDVYGTTRTWSAPIRVCEPRLYDSQTGDPLWSSEVALVEMVELALLKATPLDEVLVADLATRVIELNSLRLREWSHPRQELSALRIISLENPELREMSLGKLLTPQKSYDFQKELYKMKPCESSFGATTLAFSLRDTRFVSNTYLTSGTRSSIVVTSNAFIDCSVEGRTVSYRGLIHWNLGFIWINKDRIEDEKFSIDLEDLGLVGPQI